MEGQRAASNERQRGVARHKGCISGNVRHGGGPAFSPAPPRKHPQSWAHCQHGDLRSSSPACRGEAVANVCADGALGVHEREARAQVRLKHLALAKRGEARQARVLDSGGAGAACVKGGLSGEASGGESRVGAEDWAQRHEPGRRLCPRWQACIHADKGSAIPAKCVADAPARQMGTQCLPQAARALLTSGAHSCRTRPALWPPARRPAPSSGACRR